MASENGTRKAVVVTGASTGIGRAVAEDLAARGFEVFAGVRRDADAQALRAASAALTPVMIDVTDGASLAAARATVDAALAGRGLWGLVNNAGIAVGGPLEFIEIDNLRRQFEVNVIGQIAATQAFLPAIRRARGRIVNIGSISGRLSTPFVGPYSASKHAMEALTDALRGELRPWGIGVSIVEPGAIDTPIWEKANTQVDDIERDIPREGMALYGKTIEAMRGFLGAQGRSGIPPERVARAVAHALTSRRPKTRYLVGADARIQAVASVVVPDRLMDRLVAKQLRLPKEP